MTVADIERNEEHIMPLDWHSYTSDEEPNGGQVVLSDELSLPGEGESHE